jgi:hypothetical protein
VFEQGWCGLEGIFVGAVSENGRELWSIGVSELSVFPGHLS